MGTIGIIANPASGKDLRRLVASGTVVGNREKINLIERALLGMDALVDQQRVLLMPDPSHLAQRVIDRCSPRLSNTQLELIDLPVLLGTWQDTVRSVQMMVNAGCDCLMVLGGDGTSRIVAKHAGRVPLVPISTGTNNVFPQQVEGTLVGMALAAISGGTVSLEEVAELAPKLELLVDGEVHDSALVDLAMIDALDAAAKAVWEGARIRELVLTRAESTAIGLSSIGGCLGVSIPEDAALHITLAADANRRVVAPIAPGLMASLGIVQHQILHAGDVLPINNLPIMIALDGEREASLQTGQSVAVRVNPLGPRVVPVETTLQLAAARGFARRCVSTTADTQIERREGA